MAARKPSQDSKRVVRRLAETPQQRENQLIALATDLAEEQLVNGTASAQVVTHYLKLGSSRERLEQDKLARENELLETKRDLMASAKRVEELYVSALNAMRSYSGQTIEESDGDEED